MVQLILHSLYSRLPQDIRIPLPLRKFAACMRTSGRISRVAVMDSLWTWTRRCSVPVRVILASVIIALAFPALILSLSLSLSDSSSESGPSHHSVMVLRYAFMACQCGPTRAYFYDLPSGCSSLCPLRGLPPVPVWHRHCSWYRKKSYDIPYDIRGGVRCQDISRIGFNDIYPSSRILYDSVGTYHDIVKKPTISRIRFHRGGGKQKES